MEKSEKSLKACVSPGTQAHKALLILLAEFLFTVLKVSEKNVVHLWIQSNAHFAFSATQGMFSIALNNLCFSLESLMYVSKSKLYISEDEKHKSSESRCL